MVWLKISLLVATKCLGMVGLLSEAVSFANKSAGDRPISCEKIAILLAQKCPKMDQIPMKKSLVLLASSMAEDGQWHGSRWPSILSEIHNFGQHKNGPTSPKIAGVFCHQKKLFFFFADNTAGGLISWRKSLVLVSTKRAKDGPTSRPKYLVLVTNNMAGDGPPSCVKQF